VGPVHASLYNIIYIYMSMMMIIIICVYRSCSLQFSRWGFSFFVNILLSEPYLRCNTRDNTIKVLGNDYIGIVCYFRISVLSTYCNSHLYPILVNRLGSVWYNIVWCSIWYNVFYNDLTSHNYSYPCRTSYFFDPSIVIYCNIIYLATHSDIEMFQYRVTAK